MTTGRKKIQVVSLEEVCQQRLSVKINQSITEIELRVKPGLKLNINKREASLWLFVQIPTKRMFARLAGTLGTLLLLVKVIGWLIPIIHAYYAGLPPP